MRISDWSSDVCSSDLVQDKVEQGFATLHIVRKKMIEMVAHGIFDQACGFGTGQAILGLTLKLRIANKDRQHDLASGHDVFGLNLRCPLLTRQFAKRPDAFCKGSAQPRFMRAAVRCRNGVAVPAIAAVGPEWPGDGDRKSTRLNSSH